MAFSDVISLSVHMFSIPRGGDRGGPRSRSRDRRDRDRGRDRRGDEEVAPSRASSHGERPQATRALKVASKKAASPATTRHLRNWCGLSCILAKFRKEFVNI